jgi:hypothetical protein
VHISGKAKKSQGVRDRAHSYREDLDSSAVQLGLLAPDGEPTDTGHHFAAICERYGGAGSEIAKEFIGAALLQNGHYAALLHYIHRLSEEVFSANPLSFTLKTRSGTPVFSDASYTAYLDHLETELSQNLKVMRKVSKRSSTRRRTTLQAELTLLRRYGFVSANRFRLGVGIPIDWIKVQRAVTIEL